ncbi:MAG: hypothetical protein WBP59_13165 [Ilumatobacteraceae bacterium]
MATNEMQGTVTDDYTFTVEGELVTAVVVECASGDDCGCRRGFPGLASGFATTTAMVVDRPGVTESDLRDAVFDWLDRGGWTDLVRETGIDDVDEIIDEVIAEHVETIAEICSSFPPGTIIDRHGSLVSARSHPFAA